MSNVSFGRDTSCTMSLRTGRFATGPRLVAEAIFRRLTTPRGMLRGGEDEANYGLDIFGLVGSTSSASDVASLEGKIRNEVKKDERIQTVSVTVVADTSGPSTTANITIEATTAAGPFILQIGITDVTIELLNIQASS